MITRGILIETLASIAVQKQEINPFEQKIFLIYLSDPQRNPHKYANP
jgi:hypothetical protein